MTPSQIALVAAAIAAIAVPTVMLWPPPLPAAEIAATSVTPFALTPVASVEPAVHTPLFDITRAPPPPPELALSKPAVAPLPPAPPPVLVGAIVAPGGGLALVRMADGSTVVVRVGATVEGWQLIAVRSGRATFALGDRREDVALDFRNKGAGTGSGGAATSAAPVPSAPAISAPAISDQSSRSSGGAAVPAEPDPPR